MAIISRNNRILIPLSDPDARTFISIAGITDGTQKDAINYLVINLKQYNLWSKMKAVYPFVGGTASTHKWNLKNPVDANYAYRLTFFNSFTHSSTGCKGDGSSAYINTYIQPSVNLLSNNVHLSFYARYDNLSGYLFSASDNNPDKTFNLYGIVPISSSIYSFNTDGILTSPGPGKGLIIGTRTSSSYHALFLNENKLTSQITSRGTAPTVSNLFMFVFSTFNSPSSNYSANECAFASVGDGLSDSDSINLSLIVKQYQVILNRAVV
jgi:hypothetical protein